MPFSFSTTLFEIGTALGREHARDYERFRTHWQSHVDNSRAFILQAGDRIADPESVTILGGAASYNLPIEELAERFDLVRLIDIDGERLHQTADALPANYRRRVEIITADSTGGVTARLLDSAMHALQEAANQETALNALVPLFNGAGVDLTHDAAAVESWKASYVVSSGLASQLTIFPEKAVVKEFQEKFGARLEEDFFFKQGSFRLRNECVRRHGEFLASLALPNGYIYWADTVAETPYLSEFGPAPLSVIIQAVAAFLERAYLKTFVTEAGKAVLAKRFAEGLTGRALTGDELISAFSDKFHPEQKRRFAWAVMTLVGEQLIAPKRELELVTYIIREAERAFPHARQPLLEPPNLEAFLPDSLEQEGEAASWLWINDPEGAVTLDGYSYYVDARILKKKAG